MTNPIGGVYEMAIGTTDPVAELLYWQGFGYRLSQLAELDAEGAGRLYGVRSSLRSLRLGHGDADHGLIRLMHWQDPVNDGLGTTGMRALGNRWGATLSENLLDIVNHAEDAAARGMPIRTSPMIRQQIYAAADGKPFVEPAVCVRELIMLQPHARQVLFQRFGYTVPNYGKVDPASRFKTSQITHVGLVVQGENGMIDFYEEVLGLLRVRDAGETSFEKVEGGANVFELEPGERYLCTDFDDPRSSASDYKKARSGRLKIIRYDKGVHVPDVHRLSRPGALGPSLYTYRVRDLEAYQGRVTASAARDVTPVVANEFGEASFSFVAPDGYFWTLMGA